jgi:hypothetical protein
MNSLITKQPFTVMFAVLLGLLLAPLVSVVRDAAVGAYDRSFPVVRVSAKLVSKSADEIVISMHGTKERDCTFLRVQAYARFNGRELVDVNIRRIDVVENGDTKALGGYFLGTWRLWPTAYAKGVIVDVNHLCNDHVVVTRVADLSL